VLWIRQDPWESARQPVVLSQTKNAVRSVSESAHRGVKQPSRHGNGNGTAADVQPHQPSSKSGLRVNAPAHHASLSNGHRAAVFDNVE